MTRRAFYLLFFLASTAYAALTMEDTALLLPPEQAAMAVIGANSRTFNNTDEIASCMEALLAFDRLNKIRVKLGLISEVDRRDAFLNFLSRVNTTTKEQLFAKIREAQIQVDRAVESTIKGLGYKTAMDRYMLDKQVDWYTDSYLPWARREAASGRSVR